MSMPAPETDLRHADASAPEASRPERRAARERTCVGCGQRIAVGDLGSDVAVRLVMAPTAEGESAGEVAVDAAGGGFGRGAHVHARPDCIEKAARRGLARSFRGAVRLGDAPMTARALADAIEEAYARRTTGLLSSARRARALVVGADPVVQAWRAGEARLVVVASDAMAAAQLSEVQAAVKEGRAVVWGDKSTLGQLAGSGDREVAVLGITEGRLADAVATAIQVRESCRAVSGSSARPPAACGGKQQETSRKPSDSTRSDRGLPAVERGE